MLKSLKGFKNGFSKKRIICIASFVIAVVAIIIAFFVNQMNEKSLDENISRTSGELARAMTYDQFVDGEEAVDGTENVKFSAYFLRDINGDGNNEKIKGTCKKIGMEDTLYMKLDVQNGGVLKDAKIQINGKNFFLSMSAPKDNELKDSYIGDDIKELEFNEIKGETEKLITGVVKSGNYSYPTLIASAIDLDIDKLSVNDNNVIFTGTYVDSNGNETQINKKITFQTDWYGYMHSAVATFDSTKYDIKNRINEENETIDLEVGIYSADTLYQLNPKKNYVEGTVPQLNGYDPISVTMESSAGSFSYDDSTRKFVIVNESKIDDTGKRIIIPRANGYDLKIVYPLDAYRSLGTPDVVLNLPVKTYYEGFNNSNSEFENPYKSNIAELTLKYIFKDEVQYANKFDIRIGEVKVDPKTRYVVTKEKPLNVYNGISSVESNDNYFVSWHVQRESGESNEGLIFKEKENGDRIISDYFVNADSSTFSMENITTNIGIGFDFEDKFLGDDGFIKVYDDETDELLVTFTKKDWGKYTKESPYKFEVPVKHIRVETSETNDKEDFYIYSQKQLNDEYITTYFSREQFDNIKYIESSFCVYAGTKLLDTVTDLANYEAPFSIADLDLSNDFISTQKTEKNEILTIRAYVNQNANQVAWKNGSFLIKVPEDIIDVNLNDVKIDNSDVDIISYEYIENDNGKFIKINTRNLTEIAQTFKITIDTDITANPGITDKTEDFELWASNEENSNYYYSAEDIYDVNDNLNTNEMVHKSTTAIKLVAPTTLLTSQIASEFDENKSSAIAPKIVDLEPNADSSEKTVKIGAKIKNNYTGKISDIALLGRIPFEGNTSVIDGEKLNSEFTTKMTNAGIEIPETLQGKVVVYYSENEEADKDLTKDSNGWKTAENVSDWDSVKTFLIDFQNTILEPGDEYTFYYIVKVPSGIEFNKKTFSQHCVYFALNTLEGKYKTYVESSKLGIRIAKKYDVELKKYQIGRTNLVAGAAYKITEQASSTDEERIRTFVTNSEGILNFKNLYVNRIYTIEEIKAPENYELNNDVIKIVGKIQEDGTLKIEKTQGTVKGDIEVVKEDDSYKAKISVEDEANVKLKITTLEKDTEIPIVAARYKLTGGDLPQNGKSASTNVYGELTLNNLNVGKEYTLEEVKVNGYYLANSIKFKIENVEGRYSINVLDGTAKEVSIVEDEDIPTVNAKIENEKVPTYNLEISKIKRITSTAVTADELKAKAEQALSSTDTVYLAGAKFKLYKDSKELGSYISDSNGKIVIGNLYQYIDGKSEDAVYTLKETISPNGYTKAKDIVFKVDGSNGELKLVNMDGNAESYIVENNTVKLLVEDSPVFKLIKSDAETKEPIANIKFAIYDVEEGVPTPAKNCKGEIIGTKEIINGKEFYVVATDSNGEIMADLPEGMYKAVEIQAPDKYDISDSVYYFGIGMSKVDEQAKQVIDAKAIGGSDEDAIDGGIKTSDNGYAVIGMFSTDTLDLGNGITLTNDSSRGLFIIKYNSRDEIEWAKSISGGINDYLNTILECADGGYLVSGNYTSDKIDLGDGYSLTAGGTGTKNADGMIIKYSSAGNIEWAQKISGAGDDYICSISNCTDGGYLVAGNFQSDTIDLGNNIVLKKKGNQDGFIIKCNATGEIEWAKTIGNTSKDGVNSAIGTKDGGCIAVGFFSSSSIDLGNGMTITIANNYKQDGFIIKYNANGECEWKKSIGNYGNDYFKYAIECSDGGYLVAGEYDSSGIKLENGEYIYNKGDTDGILLKYTANGEFEWYSLISGDSADEIRSITECSDGGYLIGGRSSSNYVNLNNGKGLEKDSSYDFYYGYVAKYDKNGMAKWTKNIGEGKTYASVCAAFELENEQCMVLGEFANDKLELDNGISITNNGILDGMILKMDTLDISTPNIVQASRFGEENDDKVLSVAGTRDGGYIEGGEFFSSSIDLGNGCVLTNNGDSNGLLLKYDSDGNIQWANTIGGKKYDSVGAVVECKDGGYLVSGYFSSDTIDLGNGINLVNKGKKTSADGMILKYSEDGDIEWAQNIGGESDDYISSIKTTEDGGYLVGGYFSSNSIDLGDGFNLANRGKKDGFVIKYDANRKIEWTKLISGKEDDEIVNVAETNDGGCIAIGDFTSDNIELEDGITLKNLNPFNYRNGMIIKYGKNGQIEWTKVIGGNIKKDLSSDYTTVVTSCSDGGYLVGATINSEEADLGNGVIVSSDNADSKGVLIKYSSTGDVLWAKVINYGGIKSIVECSDGEYLIGANSSLTHINLGDNISVYAEEYGEKGLIVKYDQSGKAQWAKIIAGKIVADESKSIDRNITCVDEIDDGVYIAGGYFGEGFSPNSLDFEDPNEDFVMYIDGKRLPNRGDFDGMTFKIVIQGDTHEVQELKVQNKRKEFKITTDVEEIDNIKGGSISGEDENPYEVVKYGDNTINEIKMIPDENYEIIGITVNGKEYQYTANEDGSYTMPIFTNVTEDKNIVVRYSLKDNKIIINKVDKDTKEKLPGATFKINQVEGRTEPNTDDILGRLVASGKYYTEVDSKEEEITGKIGTLISAVGGGLVQNEDGTYVSPNNKLYQAEHGGDTKNIKSYVQSYIPINLSGLTGSYAVVINASCDASIEDNGYATLDNRSGSTSEYSDELFMNISGKHEAADYTSKPITGGKTYYLHLAFNNYDIAEDETQLDQMIINSIKLYKVSTKTVKYSFTKNNGIYESTNAGKYNTDAGAYMIVDLTNYSGTYNLTVNAEISSNEDGNYGYVTITKNDVKPFYFETDGRMFEISGIKEAKDYVTELQGGSKYYLHMSYYKRQNSIEGEDIFRINSIKISLSDSELYSTILETNLDGQAITQLPFGKYTITEIKAPDGYYLNEIPTKIEFSSDSDSTHEFTIENEKKAKVTVHHYIKGTTTKVADDENFEGKIGEKYKTNPKIDLDKYELEKDTDGNYVIPDNATGTYGKSPTEVTYYYVEKKIPLTVHYYIEGTTIPVPMKTGVAAEDKKECGSVGEEYSTSSISNDDLNDEYELVEVPSNANGEYSWKEVIVTYYYRKISREVTLIKYQQDGITPLEGAKFTINGNEYVTDSDGMIKVNLEAGTYEITEIEPPEGYKLPDNPTTEITIARDTPATINITNEKKTGTVTVHHYIGGTTTNVPLANGDVAKDEIKTGNVGDWYATKTVDNLSEGYELVSEPGNGSGTYIDGNIEVIYYYKTIPTSVIVHHYLEGTTTKLADDVTFDGIVGDNYTTGVATVDNKYELVVIPANANGKMTREQIVVIYYYRVKDTSVLVHYYKEGTSESLSADVTITGKVDDDYTTSKAQDIPSKYELVEVPTNANGKMTVAQTVVTYYYRLKETGVDVYYYKEGTTEKVSNDVEITGRVDDKYTTTPATDVASKYELVETPANATGTMTEDRITVIYYYRLKDTSVLVHHYLEGTTTKLADDVTINGQVDDTYKTVESTDLLAGKYELVEEPVNKSGKMTIEQIVVIYYYRVKDTSVLVHHYIKDTTTSLSADVIINGKIDDKYTTMRADDIPEQYELVEVPANASGTMTEEQIVVVYYYQLMNCSYTVNYLEKDTDKVLHEPKVQDGMTFEDVVTSTDEVIEIDGYNYDSVDKESLIIQAEGNVINIYYTKRNDLSYKVNYLEKDTNKVLHEQKVQDGMTFESVVKATDEVIDIYGYNYDSVDKDSLTIQTGENVINIYYTKKDTKVTVHYYEEGTTNKVSEDVEIPGKAFDDYTTTSADDIPSKYELVAEPENKTGTMTEDEITVIYYYRKKATQVIVHYYEENTTNKLSEDVTINGRVDDEYTTISANDIPIKYELVAEPVNKAGSMTEATIEVIYYYRVKDAIVNVRYLEKGTDKVLADQDKLDGKVDEDYETKSKDIDGYQLVEHTGNEKGKFEVEPLTITYYYLYKTKATVQYIDKTTGQILEQSTTEGLEGDDFVTESKDFENYVLVEEPEEKTVKMTKEEQVLKYYYIHISGGVIEKHIDVISGQILANAAHTGNEGDAYDIPSRTFEGYDLVEDRLPTNSKGTMKVEPVEVIYYYIYRTKVTTEYIDKNTGNKLTKDEVQNGHEGDSYTTERKTFDDYKLVEVPANADGSMTKEDIKVTYYYVHTSGGVIVNHVDIKTGKQLLDETKEEGYEGDPYETHEENISGYDLVKEMYPENAKGTMTIEPTRVTYYYIKKTEVNVKYVDKETGEEIDVPTNIPGHEGDDYTTEPKDLPGYDLVEEPENKNGTMTSDPIDVIYYYRRPAKVIVNYYDEDTKEKLADEIEITGHQNDEYTTEQKDIKYYEISKVPENKEGKMIVTVTKDENGKEIVEDTTYVNYYYRKLIFNLRVDKTIASVIVNGQETAINGNLGKVEIHRKELSTANVKVVYKIKVTNDSELTGKANVVENIPSGMTMIADNNPGWTINQTTASIETDEIKPGESREYQVVLGWQNGDSNVGTKENIASIVTENEAGFDEKSTSDNESKADLIVAVGTGEVPYIAIAGGILMIMISITAGVYVINKKRK